MVSYYLWSFAQHRASTSAVLTPAAASASAAALSSCALSHTGTACSAARRNAAIRHCVRLRFSATSPSNPAACRAPTPTAYRWPTSGGAAAWRRLPASSGYLPAAVTARATSTRRSSLHCGSSGDGFNAARVRRCRRWRDVHAVCRWCRRHHAYLSAPVARPNTFTAPRSHARRVRWLHYVSLWVRRRCEVSFSVIGAGLLTHALLGGACARCVCSACASGGRGSG